MRYVNVTKTTILCAFSYAGDGGEQNVELKGALSGTRKGKENGGGRDEKE